MYNCCDSDLNVNDVSFKLREKTPFEKEISFKNGADNCAVYKVPISISTFTISVHSLDTVELCVYVENLRDEYKDIISEIAKTTYLKRKTTSVINYSPFSLIKDNRLNNFIISHLSELYILVKVTDSLDTSLVVLEGTYSGKRHSSKKYFTYKPLLSSDTEIADTSLLALYDGAVKAAQDDLYVELVAAGNDSPVLLAKSAGTLYLGDVLDSGFDIFPQLLSMENTTANGLLGDCLIEYLTGNSITPLSEYYDIKKIQVMLDALRKDSTYKNPDIPNLIYYRNLYGDYVQSKSSMDSDRYYGIWSSSDHQDLKMLAYKNGLLMNTDVLGYLDKDLELYVRGVLDNVKV
jgi:hypothetical protein